MSREQLDQDTFEVTLGAPPTAVPSFDDDRVGLRPGQIVGRYTVRGFLGSGAMATVYEVEHLGLGTAHALKVLDALGSTLRRRMLREGRTQGALRHPNLVGVTDLLEVDGQPALVLELVRGPSLRDALDAGVITPEHGEALGRDLLAGMAAAHRAGVIHRDLKPANVLLDPTGSAVVAKVADFGLVKVLEPGDGDPVMKTRTGAMLGTPAYMAPEQIAGDAAIDARADVFSLGAVLYELLSGRRTFAGTGVADVLDRVRRNDRASLGAVAPYLRPQIVAVVERALAASPAERFEDAGAFHHAWLEASAEGKLGQPRLLEALREMAPVAAAPTTASDDCGGHNLPRPRDTFVGRSEERARLAEALVGHRHVTLVGPGGAGKTRLATEVGRATLPGWGGGVWFADVTEAEDRSELVATVAATLDIAAGRDAAAQVGRGLAARGRCLLILDNLEQVVDAAADAVRRWLDAAPELVVLGTSREPLKIQGEHVHLVEPFEVIAGDAAEAVELFVVRAAQARGGWEPSPEELLELRELVQVLDGLPLAIELAAARMRMWNVAALRERLEGSLDGLTRRSREGPERQRTLRAMLDWSWDLLSEAEREVLAQLSVFQGGFGLSAAEQVVQVQSGFADQWLEELVDRSLVQVERGRDRQEPRFRLLVSVQAYAAERLGADAESTRDRHLVYYASADSGPRDVHNLTVAHDRAVAQGEGRLAFDLHRRLRDSGALQPAELVLERLRRTAAIQEDEGARDRVLVKASIEWLAGGGPLEPVLESAERLLDEVGGTDRELPLQVDIGALFYRAGLYERSVDVFTNTVEHARGHPDEARWGLSFGNVLAELGRVEEAEAVYARSIASARSPRTLAYVHHNLAVLTMQLGHLDRARELWSHAIGTAGFGPIAVANLTYLDHLQGQPEQGLARMQPALARSRRTGDLRALSILLTQEAMGLLELERFEEAAEVADEALQSAVRTHDVGSTLRARVVAGLVAYRAAQPDKAEEYFETVAEALARVGELCYRGSVLGSVGRVASDRGDVERASDVLAQGEQLLRQGPYRWHLAHLLTTRAVHLARTGHPIEARASLDEALELAAEAGYRAHSWQWDVADAEAAIEAAESLPVPGCTCSGTRPR